MQCRLVDIKCKEVIDLNTGNRLGFVEDVEILLPCGQVAALVVPCPGKGLGLLAKGEDFIIPWDCVRRFGDDVILVDCPREPTRASRKKKGFAL